MQPMVRDRRGMTGWDAWRDGIEEAVTELKRALFPNRPPCPGCQQPRPRPAGGLCRRCRERIAFVAEPVCEVCGRPLRGQGPSLCLACRETSRYFDAARAPAVYVDGMRTYVRRFKYGGERELGRALGLMMAAHALKQPALWPVDVVVPMPLHRQRWVQRGFNQAELLARAVAETVGRRLDPDGLQRTRPTTKQSLLPGPARQRNVRGAFVAGRPAVLAGKHVLLVDDVLTSGATADEAARTLLTAGARRVTVLCAAVAIHEWDWRQRHRRSAL